jgi:glycosyltransferase involved in cell wall biosynthesis
MNPASYFKSAIPSWWTVVRSLRPKGGIAVLSAVWSHHATRSGYHPVGKGLGVAFPAQMRLIPAAISRWIVGQELDAAYQIALALKITRCDRLLVIDGDFNLELIESVQHLTAAKIYAVFHQIPSDLEQLLAKTSPLLVDGAVCVARCQLPFVQPFAPPGKTWFVPHGVDTDYFTPRGLRSDRPRVLCVGVHQRDFDTLRKSADLIVQAVPNVLVRLVAPRAYLPPELNLGAVELVTGLSDEQLLEEYRQAWVVLLPLIDSTANNSLLEAMASGNPVVVSDVGGVRDYIGPECGALCAPGDADAHGTAVIDLLLNSLRREAAGQAARVRAEACAWPSIREQIRSILDNNNSTQYS